MQSQTETNPKHVGSEFDSTNIFIFFIRWWKQLAALCFSAAVVAVIFSSPFFITPLYESNVLMFPTQTNSISRALFGPNVDFLEFGDVDDAERLLEVLGSKAIRDRVIERFDLFSHYDISDNDRYRNTHVANIYNGNISSRRTLYGAVEVRVRDKDPIMAADIANEIAALADTIVNDIRRERAKMAHRVAVERYESIKREISRTEDSLRNVMNRGVQTIDAQTEMLVRQLAIDVSGNNPRGVAALEERLDLISEHGGAYLTHRAHLHTVSASLAWIQRIMEETKADLDNFVPFKFLIDQAYASEKSVYPVRWLIVFLATFAAGFFGVLVIMAYENLMKKGVFSLIKSK